MCSTVRKEIQEAVAAYEDKPRDQWLFDYPAQVRSGRPILLVSLLRLLGFTHKPKCFFSGGSDREPGVVGHGCGHRIREGGGRV